MLADGDLGGLGVQEVARRLGVSEQTLRRRIWRGEIKASRSRWGRSYRWLVSPDADVPGSQPPQSQSDEAPLADAAIEQAPIKEALIEVTPPEQVDQPVWTSDDAFAAAQRRRIAETEAKIEAEIEQLVAHASELQVEIERLKRGLSALRSS
jgi:excisionase family DNA binding protein